MIDLPAIIRGAVKSVEQIAGSVRAQVYHFKIESRTATKPVYPATGIPLLAFIEDESSAVVSVDGVHHAQTIKLTFMEPVEVVDNEDKFQLPDGRVLAVLKHVSPNDPDGKPYQTDVWVGSKERQ